MSATKLPKGTTIRMAMVGCAEKAVSGNSTNELAELCKKVFAANNLAVTGQASSEHTPGCALTFTLPGSIVSLRSWPKEDNTVLAEVSLSVDLAQDRETAVKLAEELAKSLRPRATIFEECDMRPRFADPHDCNHGSYMNVEALVHSTQSRFQYLVVADTTDFGRVFALDHAIQTTERANLWYHEPLVHPALLAHPNPVRVAIVGGGDGGTAHQVISHPSVEKCVIIELDEAVVDVSRKEMPFIHQGALDSERVEVLIRDGLGYFDEVEEPFDAVILDLTDPVGPAEALYKEPFYLSISRAMTENAVLATHIGAISQFYDYTPAAFQALQNVFATAKPYLHHVPDYGCIMGFVLCTKEKQELPALETINKRLAERKLQGNLSLITAETYHALFAVPPIYESFLQGGERPIG